MASVAEVNPAVAPKGDSVDASVKKRSWKEAMGQAVDRGLLRVFGAIAKFVSRRPILTMFGCLALTIFCGFGILRIHVEKDSEKLYTPQKSMAFRDRDFVDSLYPYENRQANLYITAPKVSGANVLTKDALLAHLDLVTKLRSVAFVYGNETNTWESPLVCLRPGGPGTPCSVLSVLDYWGYNRDRILADKDLGLTVSNAEARDALGRAIRAPEVMGGIQRDSAGKITAVAAFQAKFVNQNNQKKSGSSSVDKRINAWEEAVTTFTKAPGYDASVIEAFLKTDWEENKVSDDTITSDVNLVIIGYGLLAVYGVLVLSKRHVVFSSTWLAMANIASIGMAVVCSFGICMVVGISFSLVTQLLALLLLGLGTDDTLVTLAAHAETFSEMGLDVPVEDRIQETVTRARRSVIVASATNFVAFVVGSTSDLPALRDFTIYAAVGVFFVLIFQSTFFVACLTLDVRRQKANRLDCACCVISKVPRNQGCCGGPYDADKPDVTQRLIGIYLPKLILSPVGKIAVLVITFGLLAFFIVGAVQVKEDFNNDDFIPDGSYVKRVIGVRAKYFDGGVFPFAIYTKTPANDGGRGDHFYHQADLQALSDKFDAEKKYISKVIPVQNWYPNYIAWLPTSNLTFNRDASGRPTTPADFYQGLRLYLDSMAGARFRGDIIFKDASRGNIVSTRIPAFFRKLKDSNEQVAAMRMARKLALEAAPSLRPICYTFVFLFVEGFAVIAWETIRGIIIAGAVVFLIIFLLVADFRTCILVGLMVIFVDVGLVGSLHWYGLAFNTVTSINLLLAIGIAVDYAAFTAFSFMQRRGTKTGRAKAALAHFGVAVFNGAVTLFLAVLPAAAAKSYIFQTFFKMFSSIVVLGLWHGLIALPVILSFVGSPPSASAIDPPKNERYAIDDAELPPPPQARDITVTKAPQVVHI